MSDHLDKRPGAKRTIELPDNATPEMVVALEEFLDKVAKSDARGGVEYFGFFLCHHDNIGFLKVVGPKALYDNLQNWMREFHTWFRTSQKEPCQCPKCQGLRLEAEAAEMLRRTLKGGGK